MALFGKKKYTLVKVKKKDIPAGLWSASLVAVAWRVERGFSIDTEATFSGTGAGRLTAIVGFGAAHAISADWRGM